MSDSGFTKIPSGPRLPGTPSQSANSRDLIVRLIGVPNDLREVKNPIQIAGEVVRGEKNGIARILTKYGEVDVQINENRANRVPLQEGQRVEVNIERGSPPREARIVEQPQKPDQKPDPGLTAEGRPRHAAKPEISPTPPPGPIPTRVRDTPVNVDVRPPQTQGAPAPPPTETAQPLAPQSPVPAQSVRLEPVLSSQALSLLTRPVEIIANLLTAEAALKAQLLTTQITFELTAQTLSISAPPKQRADIGNPISQFIAQTIAPFLQPAQVQAQTFPEAAITQQPLSPLAQYISEAPPPAIQFFSPDTAPFSNVPPVPLQQTSLITNLIAQAAAPTQTATTSILTPLNNTAPPTASLQINAPLNIQITNLQPPVLSLRPETQNIQTTPAAIPAPEDIPALLQKLNIAAPSPDLPPILQNIRAGEITASIIGQTSEQLPVLSFFSSASAPPAFFILHAPADPLAAGTQITLSPQSPQPALLVQSAMPAFIAPHPAYFLTPESWPLMNDMNQTLQQIAPQIAQAFSNMTPSPANPAQFGPAVMFFIAALRGGDLSDWLGQRASDALRSAGRGGLLSRLGQEGSLLQQLARESMSQDWRSLTLPMQWQNDIHKVAIHYKHEDEQGDNENNKVRGTRFIFDLTLDNMGPVQLDGLFRGDRLDVILRTNTRFSEAMQMEMKQVYAGAMAQTQIAGELSFQNRPEQWVKILPKDRSLGVSA